MAIDVKPLKMVNRFLFPKDDTECSAAVFKELWKLEAIPVAGRRVAIQAGGNVGVFPVSLARLFGKVITFEPDATNYHCLVENILSRNIENIEPFYAGLSDKKGKARVFEPANEPHNCGALQVERDKEGDVLLMTIDSFNIEHGVDLIYLDIEGYEDLALLGARKTIARCKPTIVCENKGLNDRYPSTNPQAPMEGSDEFRNWVCEEFGYKYHSRMMRDDIFVCK